MRAELIRPRSFDQVLVPRSRTYECGQNPRPIIKTRLEKIEAFVKLILRVMILFSVLLRDLPIKANSIQWNRHTHKNPTAAAVETNFACALIQFVFSGNSEVLTSMHGFGQAWLSMVPAEFRVLACPTSTSILAGNGRSSGPVKRRLSELPDRSWGEEEEPAWPPLDDDSPWFAAA